MNRQYQNIFDVSKSRTLISMGFRDYVAARVLINNGLLLQGATLASTSIEKYFKAILILNKKKSHKHLNAELCNLVKEFDPDLYNNLNLSFLELLIKCYTLRYLDDAPNKFSVVFIQYPLLAELDYSVSKIEKKFHIYQDSKKLDLDYRQTWNNKDPEFTANNYIYNGMSKVNFIETNESKVHCLRLDPNFGIDRAIIETYYTATKQPHDGNFLREFVISDYPTTENPNTGFELPFKPKFKNP